MMWVQSAAMISAALIVLLFAQGGRAPWRSFAGPLLGLTLGILVGMALAVRFGMGFEPRTFPSVLIGAICGCVGGRIFVGHIADKRAPE